MRYEVAPLTATLQRVTLEGRLDAAGAHAIELGFTAAVSASGKSTLVDLSGVGFVASLGIRMLLSNAQVLRRRGLGMVIIGARPEVLEVFETVALDQVIPLAENEAAAMALLPG